MNATPEAPRHNGWAYSATMRRRRVILVVVALLVALLAYLPLRATVFAPRYDVPSIAVTPQYRDAALLDRAWALPVVRWTGRQLERLLLE
jgi:hypothetical protein